MSELTFRYILAIGAALFLILHMLKEASFRKQIKT